MEAIDPLQPRGTATITLRSYPKQNLRTLDLLGNFLTS